MIYIDTPQALKEASAEIARSSWAAVDTEADSLHHYVEKLCLVQISVPGYDFVVDPLVPLDLTPVIDAMNDKFLLLHGADFDIRMIRKLYDLKPARIFDTLLAAQLLGYDGQGLADLAKRHCGVTLLKASQKADWSQRPLEAKHIDYAAKDTHYLKTISDAQQEELRALGRLSWHAESCEKLLNSLLKEKAESEPDELRWQVKGSKHLSPKALAILKELWDWREKEAERKDRPPFKVLHTEQLLAIAEFAEKHPGADVAELPKAPRNIKGEHRDALNRTLVSAASKPPLRYEEKKTGKPKHRRMNKEAERRFDALRKVREELAKELKFQPSLLATNFVLENFAVECPVNKQAMRELGSLMAWQTDLVADAFLKALRSPVATS
ncbi:MAG TPA: HRDC domain-containing protein [Candidatus Omnitrophota bacterium]|nr:HRDC domain-containing protein [Candidatus Omnitrophota bacterium]